MSQYDLTSRYKWVSVTYISWFSDFTLVSGNCIIYLCKQSVVMIIKMKINYYICCFFLSIYFYLFFFLVYIILILLLTCDKGEDLNILYL